MKDIPIEEMTIERLGVELSSTLIANKLAMDKLTDAETENKKLRDALADTGTKHGLLKGLAEYGPCHCKPGQLCMAHAAKDILAGIKQILEGE